MKQRRGDYRQILQSTINAATLKQVKNLVFAAANADTVDEHGSWEFGAEFDENRLGVALNWDLYGVSRDCHTKRTLAVIQVRQWSKTRKRQEWARIRKSYFLLGRNEDDTVFAHPVNAMVVQRAAQFDKDVVRAAQNWIFQADYAKVLRQGDIGFIPIRRAGTPADFTETTLQDSHHITGEFLHYGGQLYVVNPVATHLPGTHPQVTGKGCYKIIVGQRANFYSFAAPTID